MVGKIKMIRERKSIEENVYKKEEEEKKEEK